MEDRRLVAAIGENGVIGRDGAAAVAAEIRSAAFQRLTLGKPVIMGRKTYESIGKALDRTAPISCSPAISALVAPGAVWRPAWMPRSSFARSDADKRGVDEIMVIGGSDIFAAAMPLADRLEITRVHASPEGDAVFPADRSGSLARGTARDHARGPQDDAASISPIQTYETRA